MRAVVARSGGGQDLFFADHGDGQGGGHLGAADLRADHDDLIDLGGFRLRRVLSDGGGGGAEQRRVANMAVFKLRRAKAARMVILSPLLVIEPGIPPMLVRRRPDWSCMRRPTGARMTCVWSGRFRLGAD